MGLNKLSQRTHHCQAAERERGEHNHQVEQEHAHNHAVDFSGSSRSPKPRL